MASSDLGCTQNADSSLRDASEIDFFYDVDNTAPMVGPLSSNPSAPLYPLFTSVHPLRRVAGSRRSSLRRSSRTFRPSARAKDPNNAETVTNTGGHISARTIAAKHIDTLLAELDADFGYDAEGKDSEADE
ncbi:hypothetical protein DFH09DRAFT_1346344 [Mycena vulgaris]|nr:hypothetical protein DFH09DRAFT_1346344 [Mycena vulgaris]